MNEFRADINGLRGYAVLSVVLFHFSVGNITGGFVGVDIFFVISGFLMTKIISQKMALNQFRIVDFYLARVNRILPVLMFVCLTLLVFGWFSFDTFTYKALSKHILSSLGFLSNFIYFFEDGYFDLASEQKWLLHTWSLSVEWQFYFLYPILLVFLNKYFSFQFFRHFILGATLFFFTFSVFSSYIWPSASYFLLPSRVWEMTLGGVAFLYPIRFINNKKFIFEKLGVLLILLSVFFIDDSDKWPGVLATVPTLAVFLLLHSNHNGFLTTNWPIQLLGKISYSLYLWHWPILLIGNFYTIEYWTVYGLIFSFLAAYFSNRFLETKNFFYKSSNGFVAKVTFLLCFISLVISATLVLFTNGANTKFRSITQSPEGRYLAHYARDNYMLHENISEIYRLDCDFYREDRELGTKFLIVDECTKKTENASSIFIWGDSHAQALSWGLRRDQNNVDIMQVATSGCAAGDGTARDLSSELTRACSHSNDFAFQMVAKLNPKLVLFAQQKDHNFNVFLNIEAKLKQLGVTSKFVVIGPVPQWKPSLPSAIAQRHFDPNERIFNDVSFQKKFLELDNEMISVFESSSVSYISLISSLCSDNGCLTKVDDKNTPLVWDYGHLTPEGSIFVADEIIYPQILGYLEN